MVSHYGDHVKCLSVSSSWHGLGSSWLGVVEVILWEWGRGISSYKSWRIDTVSASVVAQTQSVSVPIVITVVVVLVDWVDDDFLVDDGSISGHLTEGHGGCEE